MTTRIDWVAESCRLLTAISAEFATTQPFAGLTIGTGIHLEPKTAALIMTLARGGARVIATGNLNTTQQGTVDYLRERGIEVIGGPTSDSAQHDADLREVLAAHPDLLLDNGGDLFARYLENPWDGLLGGTEETTSGRSRLAPLRAELALPILVINDSPIKQFAENKHAVGQSVFESYLRITNRSTGGKQVVVFGYGSCGQGVASSFRNAYGLVTVIDTDPVKRLEACLDGFDVSERDNALRRADIVVTVTGARDILLAGDLPLLRDDTILMNAGHFPLEIDVPALLAHPDVERVTDATDGLQTLHTHDGRRIHLATGGHMANLAGPRPMGNSIESMDLGFALQARCLEAIALGTVAADSVVVPVPRVIDEAVATSYLELVAR
ncbi:MAG: adenosylhomocysteinase [Salinibacterium sp.]|nr:adenosylhomocysteinase [Salinibacterium sp.]